MNFFRNTIYGVNTIVAEEEQVLHVIAITEDEQSKLNSCIMRDRNFEYIADGEKTYVNIQNTINDFPFNTSYILNYALKGVETKQFDSMEIKGKPLDRFFNPSNIFYDIEGKELSPKDLAYSNFEADRWKILFENNEITIVLSYGNFIEGLPYDDLRLRAKLKLHFKRTGDNTYIYRLYQMIVRFLCMITYSKKIGRLTCSLYTLDEEGAERNNGVLLDYNTTDEVQDWSEMIDYIRYKPFIKRLLQFAADNPDYSFRHYPDSISRVNGTDFSFSDLERLFIAFENECHRDKVTYETIDITPITNIRDEVIKTIENISREGLDENEVKYISDVDERLKQIGTQFGQRRKIVNAYTLLEESFSHSIGHIFSKYNYYETNIKIEIDEIAGFLTKTRGKIVHGSYRDPFDETENEMLHFFEILIYAQMLRRAGFNSTEIEEILGCVFTCNFLMLKKHI